MSSGLRFIVGIGKTEVRHFLGARGASRVPSFFQPNNLAQNFAGLGIAVVVKLCRPQLRRHP